VNVYLGLWLTCHLLSAFCYGRVYLCRSQEWALCSPSPTGFVCLEFSWLHAPLVFSSMQPVTIAVFFYYLESVWGGAPPPLSSGVCYALASFASLPLFKHTGVGEVLLLLPSPTSLFIHSSSGDCSSPTLRSSGHPLGGGQSVQGAMLIYCVVLR
jgi:hypothetical protein